MFSKVFFMFTLMLFLGNPSEENSVYHKEYYESGRMKAEGWLNNDGMKTAFWKFYHPNGRISENGYYKNDRRTSYWKFYSVEGKPLKEGRYKNGEMNEWWLFYDAYGKIDYKCQIQNGEKNGYCLKYKDEELASAVKYVHGERIKEWYSYRSFTKENSLSDLR